MMQAKYMPDPSVQNEGENFDEMYDTIKSTNANGHAVTGIVSMENILEYILGIPIMDEKDLARSGKKSFFVQSMSGRRNSLKKSYMRQGSVISEQQLDNYFAEDQEPDEDGETPTVFRT